MVHPHTSGSPLATNNQGVDALGQPRLFNLEQFNVAGGFDLAQLDLQSKELSLRNTLAQKEFGRSLLSQLMETQRDPFSIVPALTAFGQGPGAGGVQAPAVAFANSGGVGMPADPMFGQLAQMILQQLGTFATGGQFPGGGGTPAAAPQVAGGGQSPFNITDPNSIAALLQLLGGPHNVGGGTSIAALPGGGRRGNPLVSPV